MARSNPRRIERLQGFCRGCWHKLAFDFEWSTMQGKTMQDLRNECQARHAKVCAIADVRLPNGPTYTRRRR